VFERPQLRGHNYWPFISYHVALCWRCIGTNFSPISCSHATTMIPIRATIRICVSS
jgi:hypothetical protein